MYEINNNDSNFIIFLKTELNKLEKLGSRDYFKPHNPIFIISCEKGAEREDDK